MAKQVTAKQLEKVVAMLHEMLDSYWGGDVKVEVIEDYDYEGQNVIYSNAGGEWPMEFGWKLQQRLDAIPNLSHIFVEPVNLVVLGVYAK